MQTQTQTLTQTLTQTQMRTQTQTQTQTDTHKCRRRHNGQVFPHKKPFDFVRRGGGTEEICFVFYFPRSCPQLQTFPKVVAHSANDSSKSNTDMSHTLREGDSSSQTHSCLEKMPLIISIIFWPLVQIILALQHFYVCHSSPTISRPQIVRHSSGVLVCSSTLR